MTYNVFGGTLSLIQSINQSLVVRLPLKGSLAVACFLYTCYIGVILSGLSTRLLQTKDSPLC